MNLEKMIGDEKLLCAFIASAYSSGWCGRTLGEEREVLRKKYMDFIAGRIPFPEEEIKKNRPDLYDLLVKKRLREYIYLNHLDLIKGRLLNELGIDILKRRNHKLSNGILYDCFPQFCRVMRKNGNGIYVKKEFTKEEGRIIVFDGLEMPEIDDLVSVHWSSMLEKIQVSSYFNELVKKRKEKLNEYGL